MLKVASFYLLKDGQREGLSNRGCTGDVYRSIWDYCKAQLNIDCRFHATRTENTFDCVLIDEKMAAQLLEQLGAYDLNILAHQIAPRWKPLTQSVRNGLETILLHLEQVRGDTTLLYEWEDTIQEVIVMINGETLKINALRVFHSRNPKTNRYNVNFMEAGSKKCVRLFCQDGDEAETLAHQICEGKITDLTGYPAKWNL